MAINEAPTLTTISTLGATDPRATEDQPFTVLYSDLAGASNASDPDRDVLSFRVESVTGGTLTKNGEAVTPGTTVLGPTESLVWTPHCSRVCRDR